MHHLNPIHQRESIKPHTVRPTRRYTFGTWPFKCKWMQKYNFQSFANSTPNAILSIQGRRIWIGSGARGKERHEYLHLQGLPRLFASSSWVVLACVWHSEGVWVYNIFCFCFMSYRVPVVSRTACFPSSNCFSTSWPVQAIPRHQADLALPLYQPQLILPGYLSKPEASKSYEWLLDVKVKNKILPTPAPYKDYLATCTCCPLNSCT